MKPTEYKLIPAGQRKQEYRRCMARKMAVLPLILSFAFVTGSFAAAPEASPRVLPKFSAVVPGYILSFPRDFGAHPTFRTEWWYVTGWLEAPEKKSLGFQVTFFRAATGLDEANPSRFAPKQLIIAHAALSDPAIGKLLHDQKSARDGFGLAYTKVGNTDVKLGNWTLLRDENGRYQTRIDASDFALHLSLTPSQSPMKQGEDGFSRKGPLPEQASYYYSEPHLEVAGTIVHDGKPVAVSGSAWLDHEWSTAYLDPDADGWDWVGVNLDDGSALMAFQIRGKDGRKIWAYAGLRDASGNMTLFAPEEVNFEPQRTWRSPRTGATYPVAMRIRTGTTNWLLTPLQDDQELDSRESVGAVYWEGAVTVNRDGTPAGRGYFEMTGYVKPLKL